MAGSTDVQEGPCDLELSLDAPSLMSFPSFPGKTLAFFFFFFNVPTLTQYPHLDPPAGQDGPFTGSTSLLVSCLPSTGLLWPNSSHFCPIFKTPN